MYPEDSDDVPESSSTVTSTPQCFRHFQLLLLSFSSFVMPLLKSDPLFVERQGKTRTASPFE